LVGSFALRDGAARQVPDMGSAKTFRVPAFETAFLQRLHLRFHYSDANGEQPLFHVEHSVSGDELQPLNRWRIVHLTNGPKHELTELFKVMANSVLLPEFVENYIRNDLNIGLAVK
jgi:hypothetical protein